MWFVLCEARLGGCREVVVVWRKKRKFREPPTRTEISSLEPSPSQPKNREGGKGLG